MLGSRTRGARYLIIKGRTRKAQILPKVPRLFIYSDSLTLEVRWTRGCLWKNSPQTAKQFLSKVEYVRNTSLKI